MPETHPEECACTWVRIRGEFEREENSREENSRHPRLTPNDLINISREFETPKKQPLLDAGNLDLMWRGFNNAVAEPLNRRGIPLLVTPGNHDGSGFPAFALEREHFKTQWAQRMPEVQMLDGSEWPRRYASRVGSVLLIAFDGTMPGVLPDSERQFSESMLVRYGKGPTATIVFSHLPMWPLTRGREHKILDDPALLALLHQHGVDVYASGHHHAFYAGIDAAGMVHLGVGALGGNARAFSKEKRRQPFSFAVLTVTDDALIVDSRAAPDFVGKVPMEGLPESIEGPLGILRRIDGPVPLRP